MGLLDIFKRITDQKEPIEIQGVPVKVVEIGSAGTQIYGGYLAEEYLSELQGTDWADKIDQMRRSDPNVAMALKAIKLPLKSSNWSVKIKGDSTPAAELQKRFFERVLFEDLDKSFTKLIGEILTCVDFGYSLFELTYKAKLNDPEFGHYNTLKSISYRSQRTILQWNVDTYGNVGSVYQIAQGDTGRTVDIDARFLLHFAPEQEGDNFEGVSALRSMYGSFLRKNHFLRLLATGIEKYAIPIPTLQIPDGKEASPEKANAVKALKLYTSNQSNYITYPAGWNLDIKTTTFESEKVRSAISAENQEMVNSILAGFLLLGQNGASGNRALGDNLSDFFAQTLNYLQDHISEVFEKGVFKPLVKMNFGDQPVLVELKCDGLNEKADKAWSETMKILTDGKLLTADKDLEDFVREKYKLPAKDWEAQAPIDATPAPGPTQLSEKKKTLAAKSQKSKQRETVQLIRDSSELLSGLFKTYLSMLGTQYIEGMLKERDQSNANNEIKAANKVDLSVPSDYLEGVRAYLAIISQEARQGMRAIISKPSKKLSEFRLASSQADLIAERIRKTEDAASNLDSAVQAYLGNPLSPENKARMREARAYFEEQAAMTRKIIEDKYLPSSEIQANLAKSELLLDSQIADLKKSLGLQYQTSLPSTDSEDIIRKDLQDRLDKVVNGPITSTGPDIMASQTINEARWDEAQSDEEEIESWTFIGVDDDSQTEVCAELSGTTFAPNDPNLDRYTPPLHYNCRSYLAVNLKSFKGNPEIDRGDLELSKAAQNAITLSEERRFRMKKLV